MQDVGTLNASVAGTFGQWPAGAPFGGEVVSFSGNVWNNAVNFSGAGAMVGVDEEDPSRTVIAAIAILPDLSMWIMWVRVPKELVVSNTTVALDGISGEGFFLIQERFDKPPPQIVGMLGNGSIEFGEVSDVPGEPFNASITTKLWSGFPGSGN